MYNQQHINGGDMIPIVDELEKRAAVDSPDYIKKLKDAGFFTPVAGYARITTEAIYEYLEGRAKEYLIKRGWRKRRVFLRRGLDPLKKKRYNEEYVLECRLICLAFFYNNVVERSFLWYEEPLEGANYLPPAHVLDSTYRAKDKFDEIRIVTIREEDAPLPDPLVVGKMNGSSDRYLIDWWDKDIDPSELNVK
jgi:hypothetical protein